MMYNTTFIRLATLLGLLTSGVALVGCSESAGGPRLARVGVAVSQSSGEQFFADCVPVPVLWGSRSQARLDIDGTFFIEVTAEREATWLSFQGVDAPDTLQRRLTTEQLRSGYAEELEVTTLAGGQYIVNVGSECP
jgi:hypothetical protein